jgi:hypothetical protein
MNFHNDWWLLLYPHYKDFIARATTFTAIKGAYILRRHRIERYAVSHVPIILSVHIYLGACSEPASPTAPVTL